ncbi:MAG TPA: rod shape-determining protein RodA [Candidatus Limnocylindrales bacterium]|nr:rod shape-determining protein RodA [Candidatus Limnocylindrales bacterium]
MGTTQADAARLGDWTTSTIGSSWRRYDLQLTIYGALLACVGLAMAYTNTIASGDAALAPGSTFTRGLLWAAIAVAANVVATVVDYRWLRTFAWPLFFINLGLLALTLAIGTGPAGSARWIAIGDVSIQISELSKVLMIAVLANFLAIRRDRLGSLTTILGACLLVAPAWALVLAEPDLGTSLVFVAILAGMLFTSGASLRWLVALAVATAASIPIAWTYVLHDYQKQRLTAFLDPGADPLGAGYQLVQAQIAVGAGGATGRGLTNGLQNQLDFLPVQTTDFVFAVLAEELGFLGGIVLFALFLALLWRLFVAAWRSHDPFGSYFAAGLASVVFFQFVVNVGMVIGVMPITGIPLPFVTHGGASLISLALALGIVQSVNIRQTRAEW